MYLRMDGKGIPREGQKMFSEDGEVGVLTSGTYSTTLKNGIGMGYVSTDFLKSKKKKVKVDIRGKQLPAVLMKPPFVETKYYRGV